MNIPHFLYSFVNENSSFFDILATVDNAAMSIRVQLPRKIFISVLCGANPEVELLDHMVILFLNLQGTTILCSPAAVTILYSHQACKYSHLHTLPNTCYFLFLDNRHRMLWVLIRYPLLVEGLKASTERSSFTSCFLRKKTLIVSSNSEEKCSDHILDFRMITNRLKLKCKRIF